jgi:hypothetical protein
MEPDKITEKVIDLTERYLDRELDEKESVMFQKMLQDDENIANYLAFREQFPGHWETARRQEELRKIIDQSIPEVKTVPFRFSYKMAAAASLLILIGLFAVYTLRQPGQGYYSNKQDKLNVTGSGQAPYLGDSTFRPDQETVLVFGNAPDSNLIISAEEPILFRWEKSPVSVYSEITIHDFFSHRLIYYQKLNPGQTQFTLHPGILKPGKYTWFPDAAKISNQFIIRTK